MLKLIRMQCGYLAVRPVRHGRNVHRYVHRLVAGVFLGPRRRREVNHIDGDKHNNNISNLEYVTHAQNGRHAVRLRIKQRKAAR